MSPDRTPEERENARREREARRRALGNGAAEDGSTAEDRLEAGDGPGEAEANGDAQAAWEEEPEPAPPPPPPRAPAAARPRPAAPAPPARSPRSRRRHLGLRILAVAVVIVLAGAAWFALALFQPGKGSGTGTVPVRIPTGAGAREIGDLLAKHDVVASGFLFSLRATLAGNRSGLRSGPFELKHDMSYGAALTALTKAPTAAPTVEVTIPEGRSVREAAPAIAAAGLHGSYVRAAAHRPPAKLRAPASVRTLEGVLFPATYQLRRHAAVTALVARQQAAFAQNLAKVPLAYARARHLTPYDVVIVASLVERETGTASDRPKIAAVIYNRLRRHMPLGIDASLRYGVRDWKHRITRSELASSSPYNLSKRIGLPPTPIGSPGLASLRAAAHPAHASYLYFVARPGTCGSVFTTSYAAFQRASAKYRAAQRSGRKITTCGG